MAAPLAAWVRDGSVDESVIGSNNIGEETEGDPKDGRGGHETEMQVIGQKFDTAQESGLVQAMQIEQHHNMDRESNEG